MTEKAIKWIKQQDGKQPFMMCCHFKATHEPYDYPIRMEHLYDGVTFPEPENLLDWGPETNGVLSSARHSKNWNACWRLARKTPTNGDAVIPDCHSAPKACNGPLPEKPAYQKFIRDYMRCGATVDDNIGKLLKTLDEMGIAVTPLLSTFPTKKSTIATGLTTRFVRHTSLSGQTVTNSSSTMPAIWI